MGPAQRNCPISCPAPSPKFAQTDRERACRDRSCPSLPQLADPVSLGLADQKLLGEGADLEQAPDLADHAAERELALFLGRGPVGDEEDAEPGAADIGDILEVEHDRGTAGLDQRDQAIAEFLCGRAVEPAIGFDDGDALGRLFHQFHARLHRQSPSFLVSRSRLIPSRREYSSWSIRLRTKCSPTPPSSVSERGRGVATASGSNGLPSSSTTTSTRPPRSSRRTAMS